MLQSVVRLERFRGHLSEKPLHTKGSRLKSITKSDDDPDTGGEFIFAGGQYNVNRAYSRIRHRYRFWRGMA